MRKLSLLAAAAFAATAVPASATITFGTQSVGQGEEVQFSTNVHPTPPNGPSVVGFTNQTDTSVTFSTLTGQTLSTPSAGQARIEAVNGTGDQINLTSLLIQLTNLSNPLAGFGYIEFNLSETGGLGNATSVTINAVDQFGVAFSVTRSVGNGSNFFSALGSDGEVIRSISFNSSPNGFADIRQIRITPAVGANTPPVPEPATWAMMLVGFGAAGVAMRRTRRRKPLLAQIA